MGFLSVLSQAQRWVKERVKSGDIVVDATAGNGSDTLFLARAVGSTGIVYAFDIQADALENTRHRLDNESNKDALATVKLIHAGHETMCEVVPLDSQGQVKAVMFNLGYLPGASSDIITQPPSTLTALDSVMKLLCSGGVLTIVVYPGHEGGREESDSVKAWASSLSPLLAQTVIYKFPQKLVAPYLIAINKK